MSVIMSPEERAEAQADFAEQFCPIVAKVFRQVAIPTRGGGERKEDAAHGELRVSLTERTSALGEDGRRSRAVETERATAYVDVARLNTGDILEIDGKRWRISTITPSGLALHLDLVGEPI
jgi:hypothetical protein